MPTTDTMCDIIYVSSYDNRSHHNRQPIESQVMINNFDKIRWQSADTNAITDDWWILLTSSFNKCINRKAIHKGLMFNVIEFAERRDVEQYKWIMQYKGTQ